MIFVNRKLTTSPQAVEVWNERYCIAASCGELTIVSLKRLCRNSRITVKVIMLAQAGIQNSLIILDSLSHFACTEWQKGNCDTVSKRD